MNPHRKPKAVEIRDIPGFPGYRIGSDGSVWSCMGLGCRPKPTGKWKRLTPARSKDRHLLVSLGRGNKFWVHQLVAMTFIGPRPIWKEVLHRDGDGFNCSLDNLRYGTRKENCQDTVRHGRCNFQTRPIRGSRHGNAVLNEAAALKIRAAALSGRKLSDIATQFGVSISTVSLIKNNKLWRHI